MAGGEDKASKKHPASAKKKKDAKKKGNVSKSQDVGMAVGLLTGFAVITALGPQLRRGIEETMVYCFSQIKETDQIDIAGMGLFVMKQLAIMTLPILLAVALAGFLAQLGMVGFILTGEQIKPKLEKINPLKGIKKWFAIKSLVELGKSIAKIIVVFYVGWLVWKSALQDISLSVFQSASELLATGGAILSALFWKVIILYVVIATVDYAFQRYQWAKDLKMSDKEVRDEYKNQEGDPYQKAKRRQVAQQMSMEAANSNQTPQADAVVINPTELAIALKYDPELSPVPYVLAKGEQRKADEIRESARNAGIPVVRNKPLARALFEACEIGDAVPADLFKPVAEVLAYVFSLSDQSTNATQAASALNAPAPGVEASSAPAPTYAAAGYLPPVASQGTWSATGGWVASPEHAQQQLIDQAPRSGYHVP